MTPQDYMRRALQLAFRGFPSAFPNPLVGAVITDSSGKIIGEGYHRQCGGPHAEVNAVASVDDKSLLSKSTIFVTLEPCAHYGRTPPCARLIIDSGIPNVVVGTRDPFGKVDGKGISMLRQAGVNVTVGVLEDECRSLNAVFFTAHTRRRPFVILKWAQSADGYTDIKRNNQSYPIRLSTPLTSVMSHRLRSFCDGIMVGSGTVLADNPSLDTRLWAGKSPVPVILDRRHRIDDKYRVMQRNPIVIDNMGPLHVILENLYAQGIFSLLVEGGPTLLSSFFHERDMAGNPLWDLARVEMSPANLGDDGNAKAPAMRIMPSVIHEIDGNKLGYYINNNMIHIEGVSAILQLNN